MIYVSICIIGVCSMEVFNRCISCALMPCIALQSKLELGKWLLPREAPENFGNSNGEVAELAVSPKGC